MSSAVPLRAGHSLSFIPAPSLPSPAVAQMLFDAQQQHARVVTCVLSMWESSSVPNTSSKQINSEVTLWAPADM